MEIALLTGAVIVEDGAQKEHPDIAHLRSVLQSAGLSYVTLDRAPGEVQILPCIAALDDAGIARKTFTGDVDVNALKQASQADGTPEPVPQEPVPEGPALIAQIETLLADLKKLFP